MKYNDFDEDKFKTEPIINITEVAHDLDDAEFIDLANQIELYDNVPEATDIAREIFVPTQNLALEVGYNAEYRGWYGTRWCPQQSKFGGRGENHKGSDIFCTNKNSFISTGWSSPHSVEFQGESKKMG